MSLRARIVGTTTAVTLVTLCGAFAAVSLALDQSHEDQLDVALRAEAFHEAGQVTELAENALTIEVQSRFTQDDVTFIRYGALYGADGQVVAGTSSFRGQPPPARELSAKASTPFDMVIASEHLRAVQVEIPRHPGVRLLLATPRTSLDGDTRFRLKAMLFVFLGAVAWVALVSIWTTRRLVRDHERIADVTKRVARGDLSARVSLGSGDAEMMMLANNVDEMIERLDALVRAQREFVAHAAHELRSPLTTLYGELSHALRKPRAAAEYERAIEEALASTLDLRTLADDLLAFARVVANRLPPADDLALADIVDGAQKLVAKEARARDVRIVLACDTAKVRGHARDLERLVRNLLENAVEHSPAGGTVSVTTRAEAGKVTLTVEDEGPGVAAQDRERVFEPFFRRESASRQAEREGAGLGLSIARGVAEGHGGTLTLAASGEGSKGARFVLELPAHSPGTSPPALSGAASGNKLG